MVSSLNVALFFDIVVLLMALIVSGRVLYLNKNLDDYLRKHRYKKGTVEYARIMQLASPSARRITLVVTPLIFAKTIFDIFTIFHERGGAGLVGATYIIGFVCLITIGVSIMLFGFFKRI